MRQRRPKPGTQPGFAEESAPFGAVPDRVSIHQTVELGAGGRLVIPARMRAALGMKVGDRLTVRLDGDELRIHTYLAGIRRIQERARKRDPEGKHGVDEFLAERRREAAKELKEFGDG